MNSEDRYHTSSWDARQMPNRPDQAQRPPSGPVKPRKKKKKRINPLLGFVLWVAIVGASSAIFASVGWLLANDFAALNKTPRKEVSFEVPEDWVSETRTNEDGKEITCYDLSKVAKALKEDGLIEYPWFFRLFGWVYKADTKISQGTFTLTTDMDYMALIRNMRTSGGSAETVTLTIPEGYSVKQIIDLMAKNGVGTEAGLTETAQNFVFEDFEFIDNDNLGNISRLEGYLFPDTYNLSLIQI